VTRELNLVRLTGLVLAAGILAASLFTLFDVVPAASQDANLRAWRVESAGDLMDPWSSTWSDIRPGTVALSAQNATKPLGGGEVATLKTRSVHDGKTLYVLMEWKDGSEDDTVNGHTAFADAAAVEFPAAAGVSVPSFCMGDANGTVNIWHWKAAWQRDIDSGYTTGRDRYPDGFVDQAPDPADSLYQPARYVGNPLAQTQHASPVENLIAASFGTLTTTDVQDVQGRGEWKDGRWRVVFARDLRTAEGYPSMATNDITNIAFAVWDGSKGNRDGIKSVSQFMNLQISDGQLNLDSGGVSWWWLPIVLVVSLAAFGGLISAFAQASRKG
jgi:hypothetical protein